MRNRDNTKQGILPLHITGVGQFSNYNLASVFDLDAIPGNAAWPAANRGIAVPLFLPAPAIVNRFMYVIGTTGAVNVDIGIYRRDLTKIITTGSTAVAGSNACTFINVTDTLLAPGHYWMAMSCDSTTTTTFNRIAPGQLGSLELSGCKRLSTSFPLPDPIAPVAITDLFMPLFGFTQSATL